MGKKQLELLRAAIEADIQAALYRAIKPESMEFWIRKSEKLWQELLKPPKSNQRMEKE